MEKSQEGNGPVWGTQQDVREQDLMLHQMTRAQQAQALVPPALCGGLSLPCRSTLREGKSTSVVSLTGINAASQAPLPALPSFLHCPPTPRVCSDPPALTNTCRGPRFQPHYSPLRTCIQWLYLSPLLQEKVLLPASRTSTMGILLYSWTHWTATN